MRSQAAVYSLLLLGVLAMAGLPWGSHDFAPTFEWTEPATPILCGDMLASSTLDGSNDVDIAQWEGCEVQGYYDGPDQSFSFELTEAGNVWIQLEHDTAYNLDLFLTDTGQLGTCLHVSDQGDSKEALLLDLPAGTYRIIVDGREGQAGAFTLQLQCFPLPNICELSAQSVLSGETVADQLKATIPLEYLRFDPCWHAMAQEPFGALYLLNFVGATDSFALHLQGEDPSLRLTVYTCNGATRSPCIASAQDEISLKYNRSQLYYVLVSASTQVAYQLDVSSDVPCQADDIVDLTSTFGGLLSGFTGSVKGAGDDYNMTKNNIYDSCHFSASAGGEDIVLILEPSLCKGLAFDGSPGLAVVVFEDLCGGTCLATYLTTEEDTIIFFDGLPAKAILVIDEIDTSYAGQFSLFEPNDCSICMNVAPAHHEISYPPVPSLLVDPSDLLFLDAPAIFDAQPFPGSQNFYQAGQDGPDDDRKCGFDPGDPLTFKVQRALTKKVEVLTPIYEPIDSPFVTATNIFQPQGKSVIIDWVIKSRGVPQVLEVSQDIARISEFARESQIEVRSNTRWYVRQATDTWFSVSPKRGDRTQPIVVTASENSSTEERTGSFLIVGPDGITREVRLAQAGELQVSSATPSHGQLAHIYPSPFHHVLAIEFKDFQGPFQVTLVDIFGQVQFDDTFYQAQVHIATTALAPGMYFVRVIEGDRYDVQAIVKP